MREFWGFVLFLFNRQKLYIIPILAFMFIFAAVLILGGNPTTAPFIYALF